MFEKLQDIVLLRNSLGSAAYLATENKLQGSLCHLDDKSLKVAVDIVSGTVSKIIALNLCEEKEKELDLVMKTNRRLHAAVFYSALRSCGIACKEAEDFYSSITYNFPSLDWEFYVHLNMRCCWSAFFIECALQLPIHILAVILKKILQLSLAKQIKFYIWHMSLQVIILNLFEEIPSCVVELPFNFHYTYKDLSSVTFNDCVGENLLNVKPTEEFSNSVKEVPEAVLHCGMSYDSADSSFALCHDKSETSFNVFSSNIKDSDVDLNSPESVTPKGMNAFKVFSVVYNDIYNHMYSVKEYELENMNYLNIFLHALKTICRHLNEMKCNASFIHMCSVLKEFDKIFGLLKECLALDLCQRSILTAASKHEYSIWHHLYITTSWEIDEAYLMFVLLNSWKGVMTKFSKNPSIQECGSSSTFYCNINDVQVYKLLKSLSPLSRDDLQLSEKLDKHVSLLARIIQFSYPCAVEAVEVLLSYPVIFERNEVLCVLEETFPVFSVECLYSVWIKAVGLACSQDSRVRLLKIFFKMLQSHLEMYNKALEEIFTAYGNTAIFKLPDFDIQLTQFLRKTLSLQEAEEILPSLFTQSSREVLKCVIQQAIMQGPGGNALIQVLKHVPVACQYQKNEDAIPPLIEELQNCFAKEDLKPIEEKSILNLIKVLIEVQLEREIFLSDMLFAKCLIPNLDFRMNEKKICLNLERLNVILKTLFQKNALKINSENLMMLVKCLCHIINICIESGNGKLKEAAVSALFILEDHEKLAKTLIGIHKHSLKSELFALNPLVILYASPFLERELDVNDLPMRHLWTWCCITKDVSIFKDKIKSTILSYVDLVNILTEVLSHFTKDEWLHSLCLLSICFKEPVLTDDSLLPNLPFKASKNKAHVYIIIRCFLESLHFLLQMDNVDFGQTWLYFSNTLMDLLNKEGKVESSLLFAIFLDLCFFASDAKLKETTVFTSLLLELKKRIVSSCADVTSKREFRNIISYSMKHFHSSPEQVSLHCKLDR